MRQPDRSDAAPSAAVATSHTSHTPAPHGDIRRQSTPVPQNRPAGPTFTPAHSPNTPSPPSLRHGSLQFTYAGDDVSRNTYISYAVLFVVMYTVFHTCEFLVKLAHSISILMVMCYLEHFCWDPLSVPSVPPLLHHRSPPIPTSAPPPSLLRHRAAISGRSPRSEFYRRRRRRRRAFVSWPSGAGRRQMKPPCTE